MSSPARRSLAHPTNGALGVSLTPGWILRMGSDRWRACCASRVARGVSAISRSSWQGRLGEGGLGRLPHPPPNLTQPPALMGATRRSSRRWSVSRAPHPLQSRSQVNSRASRAERGPEPAKAAQEKPTAPLSLNVRRYGVTSSPRSQAPYLTPPSPPRCKPDTHPGPAARRTSRMKTVRRSLPRRQRVVIDGARDHHDRAPPALTPRGEGSG